MARQIPYNRSNVKLWLWLAPFVSERLKANTGLSGASTDPARFDDEDLMERELSYGRSGFSLQFMLDTRLSDADRYPLKLSELIVMATSNTDAPEKLVWAAATGNVHNDLPCVGLNGDRFYGPAFIHGAWISYTGSVMAIDPAGRGKDETAVCVVKMLNGFLYLTAMRAYKEGYGEDTLADIVALAKREGVNKVIIEANFGDGMFTQLISPFFTKSYPVEIAEVKHNKQKEARIIDTLEPVLNQHKLVVNKDVVVWDYNSTKTLPPEVALKYQLMYQMSRITRDRGALAHDDRLDCLTMAVGYWVEQMGQDVDKRIEARNDTLMMQELEAWDKGAKSAVTVLLASTTPAKGAVDMKFSFSGLSVGAGGNHNHQGGWIK